MSNISRRKLITTGLAATVGAAGLAAADRIARRYGLIPPDSGGIYGPGETLTYAAHRLLAGDSPAREFRRDQVSTPFANEVAPLGDEFKKFEAGGFAEWRLTVDGLVARPTAFTLADIRSFPRRSNTTQIACEEGWSYIAVWIGAPLSHLLELAGIDSRARYVVYRSIQKEWWESLDMNDAMHPQTLVTYGMNGGELSVPFGGPIRLRVPRQLGYKSVKYLTSITVTDDITKFGKGLGSASPEGGYAWYAGI